MDKFMDFGRAISELKDGKRVAREGWNGKGMFLFLQPGYPDGIKANANTAKGMGIPEGTEISTRPYIAMVDAQGYVVTGWLASQTDMLAEDWQIVEVN